MSGAERAPLPAEATRLHGAPHSTGDTPRNRLAAAMRQLTAVAVGQPIPDDRLSEAAASVAGLASALEAVASSDAHPVSQPDNAGHPQDFFPTSPMIGFANPLSPPVDLWSVIGEDGQPELRGRVVFGYPYEGPPTCVHGGVIAELMDELLGSANIITDRAGMTGTLTIKYRRPTPLLTSLGLVARQTRLEGRKIFSWGGIYHDGELTAEAEGIFIEVNPTLMASIVTGNAKAAGNDAFAAELQAFAEPGGIAPDTETAGSEDRELA